MVNRAIRLLNGATSTGAGSVSEPHSAKKTFHALGRTTSGSGSAIIKIQGSLTGGSSDTEWIDVAAITLTLGTTQVSDGFASDSAWVYMRPNVTTLTGTGASVDLYMGVEDLSRYGHAP